MSREVRDERGVEHHAICISLLQGKNDESVSPNCSESTPCTEIIKSGELKQDESKRGKITRVSSAQGSLTLPGFSSNPNYFPSYLFVFSCSLLPSHFLPHLPQHFASVSCFILGSASDSNGKHERSSKKPKNAERKTHGDVVGWTETGRRQRYKEKKRH